MISASDVLQIISEIHQYSTVLLELKDATTVGISNLSNGKMTYFKSEGRLGQTQRSELVSKIYSHDMSGGVQTLSVDELLKHIEGKKAKHIWLETAGRDSKELGFVSVSELKAFFRSHPHR
jgi:hypothetical protein